MNSLFLTHVEIARIDVDPALISRIVLYVLLVATVCLVRKTVQAYV